MFLVASSPTPSPTVVVVVEHSGWDWGTTIAVVAAGVAVLALLLNFLTIPKGRLWLDPDPAHTAVWMYNLGDGDLFNVFYRIVPVGGSAQALESEGIVPPHRSTKSPGLRYGVNPGERLEIRYSVAPFHTLRRHRAFRQRKAG